MTQRIFAIFCFCLICIHIHAQERKKIVRNYNERDNGRNFIAKKYTWKEVFYVIGNDEMRDGEYALLSPTGKTSIIGYFSLGKKDSVWKYFNNKGILICQQWYRNDEKVKVWEFYDPEGNLSWNYDFDSSFAPLKQPENTIHGFYFSYQDDQGNWIKEKPDKLPIMLSTKFKWFVFLMSNLRYPDDAVEKNQQGRVTISILVDEQGQAIQYEVETSSGYSSLDEESLRLVKLYNPEFTPAENNGKKVKFKFVQDISFKLEYQ
jgi:TonB family protein